MGTGVWDSISPSSLLYDLRQVIYVLAIINSAAMNIGVHVSLSLLVSSVFLALLGLCCCTGFSLVAESRGYSLVVGVGFSLQWPYCRAQVLGHTGFSSCGVWAQ